MRRAILNTSCLTSIMLHQLKNTTKRLVKKPFLARMDVFRIHIRLFVQHVFAFLVLFCSFQQLVCYVFILNPLKIYEDLRSNCL